VRSRQLQERLGIHPRKSSRAEGRAMSRKRRLLVGDAKEAVYWRPASAAVVAAGHDTRTE
jgi:hypothetical protein